MKIEGIKKHNSVDQNELNEARAQLHHALQVIPSVGRAFLEHKKDDSHTNMGWDAKAQAFVGHKITAGSHSVQIGVSVAKPAVLFHHSGDERVERFDLEGATLKSVHTWLSDKISKSDLDASKISWKPGFEIPKHAVLESGQPLSFSSLTDATVSLAAWFGNSFEFMRAVSERESCDLPRCWPHHFDVGILKSYGNNDKDEYVGIGMGLSPGDETHPAPYYYTSPYPAGEIANLPVLKGGGKWQTDGFVSILLHAADIIGAQDQAGLVGGYLDEAIAVCKARIGVDSK